MSSAEPSELKGQAQRGAQSRRAIVAAALDVFAVRGFRAGALTEIADKVGLTPAAILYHFGSKDALLVAVIAERDRRASDVLARSPEGDGLASIRGVMDIAELIEREPGLAALHTVLQVESFDPESPAHEYFLERSRVVRAMVEFVAFQEGASVMWLLDDNLSIVDLYRSYVDGFIESVAAR
jgi:AcrR family transcriptional regulator